jgi:hypothetical protein
MNVLYPVFTMMALTFFCLVRLGYLRAKAVKSGEVDFRFYRLYRGYEEPEKLAAYSRHVIHHFETPILFYVLCIIAFITGQTGLFVIGLAWTYVALRFIHSYVHLTSNVVVVRFRLFVLSMLVMGLLWAVVLTGIMRQ